MAVRTELKVALGYLVAISTNVWAGVIAELPSRIRDMVQHFFTALPIVFVLACFYPVARPWIVRRLLDWHRTISMALGVALISLFILNMRLRGRTSEEIAGYLTATMLLLAFMTYRPKTSPALPANS